MLSELNIKNKKNPIYSLDSELLNQFGQEIKGIDFTDMNPIATSAMDFNGPGYIKDLESFKKCASYSSLESLFGKSPIQAGICFGNNILMNGMEYHKSSEIIIAVTDMVLILGSHKDIKDNRWDSILARSFYLPKGAAVELYAGTLHLAPSRVDENPFCSIIVLPKGTNTPLEREESDDKLLFMENKWLICHKDSPAVSRGGFVGIIGDNIEINTL